MKFTFVGLPPTNDELTTYQVLDDLKKLPGPVWREIDEANANEQGVIDNILMGLYERPLRIVAFNTFEGWSRDVTREVAAKLLDTAARGRLLTPSAWDFVERVTADASSAS